jgi:hypothetical protein
VLDACYRRFVREVVVPLLFDDDDGGGGGDDVGRGDGDEKVGRESALSASARADAAVVDDDEYDVHSHRRRRREREVMCQVKPNFRCHIPGTGHLLVHTHRDADYHHQPNEVNFWMPLTPCFGANTVRTPTAHRRPPPPAAVRGGSRNLSES